MSNRNQQAFHACKSVVQLVTLPLREVSTILQPDYWLKRGKCVSNVTMKCSNGDSFSSCLTVFLPTQCLDGNFRNKSIGSCNSNGPTVLPELIHHFWHQIAGMLATFGWFLMDFLTLHYQTRGLQSAAHCSLTKRQAMEVDSQPTPNLATTVEQVSITLQAEKIHRY